MKLKTRIPEWHATVAAELARDFSEVSALSLTADRRKACLGLKCICAKKLGKRDNSIPHGQFGAWLRKNCPQIPASTLGDYMRTASSLCEKLGWTLEEMVDFDPLPYRLLELPAESLSVWSRAQQLNLFEMVDGKGKFRAVTEYKQLMDGDDLGDEHPKVGRRDGEGAEKEADGLLSGIDKRRRLALHRSSKLWRLTHHLKLEFTLLDDEKVELLRDNSQRLADAANAWLTQPVGIRNLEAVEAAWERSL